MTAATTEPVRLRWLTLGDDELLHQASHLFDEPVQGPWVARFLGQAGHHLCLASVSARPAGFVSGVEMTHPDKGTEMFLYELGVDEVFRGRGIGTALVEALADRARALGCTGMWVLTERDNEAAMATYRRAGAAEESDQVMLGWPFEAADGPTPGRARGLALGAGKPSGWTGAHRVRPGTSPRGDPARRRLRFAHSTCT